MASTDACAVADRAAAAGVLGELVAGPPKADSSPSADGRETVLNCTFISAADPGTWLQYTQRLHMGAAVFATNRDQVAAAKDRNGVSAPLVPLDGGYWQPTVPRLVMLDGDDLVAITVHHATVDLARAQEMMRAAIARRHGAPPPTTSAGTAPPR